MSRIPSSSKCETKQKPLFLCFVNETQPEHIKIARELGINLSNVEWFDQSAIYLSNKPEGVKINAGESIPWDEKQPIGFWIQHEVYGDDDKSDTSESLQDAEGVTSNLYQ